MTRPRNITRIDHKASHTYAWRTTLQRWNGITVKTFSDSVHHGERNALKAALAYRNRFSFNTRRLNITSGFALAFARAIHPEFLVSAAMTLSPVQKPAVVKSSGLPSGSMSVVSDDSASSSFRATANGERNVLP